MRRHARKPLCQFIRERADVRLADLIEVSAQHSLRGSKETRVDWVRIRATDELEFHHIVSGNHSGRARVELGFESLSLQPVVDRIDARSNNEHRTLLPLGQKVA